MLQLLIFYQSFPQVFNCRARRPRLKNELRFSAKTLSRTRPSVTSCRQISSRLAKLIAALVIARPAYLRHVGSILNTRDAWTKNTRPAILFAINATAGAGPGRSQLNNIPALRAEAQVAIKKFAARRSPART